MQGQYASRPLHGRTACWADLKLLTLDTSPLRAARRCRLNDCVPAHLTLGPAGHSLHFPALAGCAMAQHAARTEQEKMSHDQDAFVSPKLGPPTFVEQLSALCTLLLSCQCCLVIGQDHPEALALFWLAL
jgi:hypothetical protein